MSPNAVDWIALALIAFCAFAGFRRGLVASALSLGGLVLGAYLGSRAAPHLLNGGAASAWAPFASLAGALLGAFALQTAAGFAASFVRGGLRLTPFRLLDSLGGLLFGVVTGLVLVWVIGATLLLVPGQPRLRRAVRGSAIVRRLDEAVPPRRLLHLLARVDPFPSIAGPAVPSEPLSPRITHDRAVSRASAGVVRILGTACGVGVEGSGWFAAPHLVVTAAHVVAGERSTGVTIPSATGVFHADVVAFDAHDDVAVLRVPGFAFGAPLRLADPHEGDSVAIVGYPQDGPLTLAPGRIGTTQTVLTRDAYGNGPVSRLVTALAGSIEHGNSGGPALDSSGAVQATVFAARIGAPGGYGVPASVVRRVLASAGSARVSTGSCASG